MLVSPQTLRDYCLDFLRQTIGEDKACLEEDNRINGHLIEELLESLSLNCQLTDEILLKPIFDVRCTQLSVVSIPNASHLSSRGLRALRPHRIHSLRVNRLEKCTINELIGCLGDHSLQRLRSLNVSRSSFASANRFCVMVGLAKLQSLQALDVSHTEFNQHGLEIVVEDLPQINCLNISATRVRDISPLRRCKHRLRSLSMYNLRSQSGSSEEFVPILIELHQLVHLDISDDRDNPLDVLSQPIRDCTSELLLHWQHLPRLQSLDLSGREAIDSSLLMRFVSSKQLNENSDSIHFLGLMQCSTAFDQQILDLEDQSGDGVDQLVISGNASERQIREALRRYVSRPTFVQKSLFHLYNYTLTYSCPRADLIDLIVVPMRAHYRLIGIQMAATACLYNLTKNDLGDKIHPAQLQKVVEVTLLAMQTFPNHQQLQKNALLTLCSDRILQDVTFDRFKCTQLVLDSLVGFKETAMNRMAVAICSILAAKISTSETSHLGAKPVYMEALLDIVRQRVGADNDIMLKFTLSALWNLTDESPKTCEMFLEKGGMALYLFVLKSFSSECAVETKVLGLLNNIAEVSHLRHNLMNLDFLLVLRELMRSSKIDVSYFAAGIFAHLCCDGIQCWTYSSLDLNQILDELVDVVLDWETPEIEMVAYRSFLPFIPLLKCAESPAVQLWAIWAIHHVCSKNPKRYCEMLIEENGVKTIQSIVETETDARHTLPLKNYCARILDVIHKEFPNIY